MTWFEISDRRETENRFEDNSIIVRKVPAEGFAGFIILLARFNSARFVHQPLRWRRIAVLCCAVVLGGSGWAYGSVAGGLPMSGADSAPKITSVQPPEAQPGSHITVKIQGKSFDSGAYVFFSDPAIHVLATRRVSDTQLEADIAVGEMAKQQSVVLYVSNPSGASTRTAFAIASGTRNTPQEIQSSSADVPVVTKVDPPNVAPGRKENIKVSGKNFKEGAKVAFSNPGIRVLGTEFKRSTQLIAQIEVASNAPTGTTSLFVINPDDSEVETSFEVSGGNSTKSGTASASASTQTQQFSVYNLGDATSIFKNPGRAKGQLIIEGGNLKYEQDGKVVFTAKPGDIQEIAPNVFLGLNTGTFHIILNSGKTYNFVSSSLTPVDTNSIVESLQRALK